MSDEQTQINDAILTNATSTKSISVDGQTITSQDISAQIAASKFIASQAAVNSDTCGIVRRRNKFPGASGLHS